jgi:hypothetical protein
MWVILRRTGVLAQVVWVHRDAVPVGEGGECAPIGLGPQTPSREVEIPTGLPKPLAGIGVVELYAKSSCGIHQTCCSGNPRRRLFATYSAEKRRHRRATDRHTLLSSVGEKLVNRFS